MHKLVSLYNFFTDNLTVTKIVKLSLTLKTLFFSKLITQFQLLHVYSLFLFFNNFIQLSKFCFFRHQQLYDIKKAWKVVKKIFYKLKTNL